MSKPLSNIPGNDVVMLTVECPPGGYDPVHRHNAHGFIYMLEGSIIMGVKRWKAGNLDSRTDVL